MKRAIIHFLCVIACALAGLSCSKVHEDIQKEDAIRLKVAVTSVDTKAAAEAVPYRGTTPTKENPLNAHVFFSTQSGVYPHDPVSPYNLPARSKVEFVDATFTYPDMVNGENMIYPAGDVPVYCVGLAPSDDKWTVSADNKVASHEIDGSVDLMYAPQITGKWSQHFPMQEYRHALTWIKIAVCATDVYAKDFWGDITEIEIESSSMMNLELATGALSYSDKQTQITAFEGTYELKPTICEIGSVFCSPEQKLIITIKSERITNKKVIIQLPSQSVLEETGKMYIVELYFNSFDVVEGKCSIQPWEYQDENISMK